jgi:hypothetical protein
MYGMYGRFCLLRSRRSGLPAHPYLQDLTNQLLQKNVKQGSKKTDTRQINANTLW